MQQYSTRYIIIFTTLVCLVCSFFVATAAVSLKDLQAQNLRLDRQKKVLVVAGLMEEGAKLSPDEITQIFDQRVKPRIVDLETGAYADAEVDAATYNQRKATKEPDMSHKAPPNPSGIQRLPTYGQIFQVQNDDGKLDSIIIPIEGKGLWGTLYGYLALAPDTRGIKGITFYEHKETPGLGGEVDNPRWKNLWKGRLAYDDRWRPAIGVIKGAAGPPDRDPYSVDGLSGATLTSRGVNNLVKFWLGDEGFGPYLAQVRTEAQ